MLMRVNLAKLREAARISQSKVNQVNPEKNSNTTGIIQEKYSFRKNPVRNMPIARKNVRNSNRNKNSFESWFILKGKGTKEGKMITLPFVVC